MKSYSLYTNMCGTIFRFNVMLFISRLQFAMMRSILAAMDALQVCILRALSIFATAAINSLWNPLHGQTLSACRIVLPSFESGRSYSFHLYNRGLVTNSSQKCEKRNPWVRVRLLLTLKSKKFYNRRLCAYSVPGYCIGWWSWATSALIWVDHC